MVDMRVWNYRGGPKLTHKIRPITQTGSIINEYGISVPKPIATQFLDCRLIIHISGNSIILESGCRAFAIEIREQQKEQQGGTNILVIR